MDLVLRQPQQWIELLTEQPVASRIPIFLVRISKMDGIPENASEPDSWSRRLVDILLSSAGDSERPSNHFPYALRIGFGRFGQTILCSHQRVYS